MIEQKTILVVNLLFFVGLACGLCVGYVYAHTERLPSWLNLLTSATSALWFLTTACMVGIFIAVTVFPRS